MDPIIGGALLGGASQLLGGIFGRRSERRAIREQNEYNKPVNIRARAEAAGFNPLLFVGPGVGQQTATGGSNFMGQAIADAGLMLADKITERQASVRLGRAMDENRRLNQQLTQATIRPKVVGIYAGSEMLPTISGSLGGGNGSAYSRSRASVAADQGSSVPLGPNPYDQRGKLAGIWVDGAFIPRPSGYSSGNDIEQELGDSVAAETAVLPLATAYAAASADVMAKHGIRLALGHRAGSRALPKDWRVRAVSVGNRGRAPNDLILTDPRSPAFGQSVRGTVRSW